MPSKDDGFGAAAYADRTAARHRKPHFQVKPGLRQPALTVAELRPEETVLDLGSGGGLDVLLSARRVAPDGIAYGLDASPDMLTLARANAEKAQVANARFLQGHIENIPLPDDHVDGVLLRSGVKLSGDKARVLAEAYRVLGASQADALGVGDVAADDGMDTAELGRAEQQVGCLAGTLTPAEYERMLAAAGFANVTITSTSKAADGLNSAIIQATKPADGNPEARRDSLGDRVAETTAEPLEKRRTWGERQ